MRKALFLAYHFPPIGGAGVQRTSKIVRYLRDFGYEPVVLTGSGAAAGEWTPKDPSLQKDIPDEVQVRRITAPEAAESGRWRSRAERWLALERPWSSWWTSGVLELARAHVTDVDVIYAPLVPYQTHAAAARLRESTGLPLVIDLHDPWALDEMMVYPTGLHRQRAMREMRSALNAADAIVMSTPEAHERVLEAFPELLSKRVVTISNGFDAADFAGPPPQRDDDVFRIVHTGYLHTELGRENRRFPRLRRLLGGSIAEVDILTRSHVFILEAVDRVLERSPELGPIEVHLAGVLSEADREVAAGSQTVRLHGYVPHADAVALMRSADLLFLPMHELAAGRRVGIIPGKTFEYLAARRPILAAIPEGDARDLLLEAGNALFCAPSDVAAMASLIEEQVRRKRAGSPPREPDDEVVRRCEWRRRTQALTALFDLVVDEAQGAPRERAVAG